MGGFVKVAVRRKVSNVLDRNDAMMNRQLSIEGLCHSYGERLVLQDIAFHAEAGEIVCLLGQSGCGKTTLLRLIAGLERVSGGCISLDGIKVSSPSVFVPPERRGVGFMFQDYALFPHLTVFENAMFGFQTHTQEAVGWVTDMLAHVGLDALSGHYPHMLSAGEQQRAALVRALAPRPRILLMDEPFSNLDVGTRDGARDTTLALLDERGSTAVIVTHDPAEAMRIADRIVLMHAGKLVQIGTPADIYRRPNSLYAARYFSDLNEIDGMCKDGEVATALGAFPAPGLDSGPATLCIRPHDIELSGGDGCWTGRVKSIAFLGESTLLSLDVDGLATALRVKLSGNSEFTHEQSVKFTIHPKSTFCLSTNQS